MSWQGINEFVAVAESNSFSLAAKQLNISTAQVSRQISTLEKRLQVKLFYRTTRRVSLTEEAQLFYQHCRNLLDGLNNAEQAITNLQSKPQGNIKLTVPVTYGEQKILPLVNDFVALHDGIEVTTELTNNRVDLIDGGFDVAIRLGQLQDSSLIAKKLSQRSNFVCASKAYLQKHGEAHSLSELKQHNCLLGTRDYWRFIELGKEKNIRVKGNLRCNSGLSLVDAALKNIGIVQLPDYYVQSYIESGQLVTILDQFREPSEGIWAVYPQNRYLSPKIRLLIDHLSANLK
ncbi:LysR substrate-binding domain-containing protein [Psychromonas sp. 14N.309.X.WAT.B.A12]|uniref:LysR substrate-binding domain-containing protein n=1 Tax=unclassified Psychromonas TaxID=2614957 RepID=UPI0025AFF76A|nr:LysR substrate-binding domain-containing protein [Psychromonas sp. 14N.309.X.WAT.B.A12]MDN2663327.1 LysR substrate-binding domain-containing protein [Psychromonas sp. 14N.309.X.WAT.B.A12]